MSRTVKSKARTTKVEPLGKDKYGKQWLVRIDDTGVNGIAFFYIFPAETSRKDIRALHGYIMEARVQKLDDGLVCMGDISHEVTADMRRPPNSLHIFLNDNNHTDSDCDKATNWENRGIGELLIKRLEKWTEQSGCCTIYGLLSPYDNIEKLKHFYQKCGWQIEIFSEERKREEGQDFYIGKVTRCSVSSH
ncbi:MAG: GNAT family N-acetyltransferase [Chloroflexi bacterium]|nr:GNAT family N-acetyltransferase [Chloroflexota bacterium]